MELSNSSPSAGQSLLPAAGLTATLAALRHMKSLKPTTLARATRIAACSSIIFPVRNCESLNSARNAKVTIRTAITVSTIA